MAQSSIQPRPRRSPPWLGPLAVGLCFGLGYGITQRLLALRWTQYVQLGQGFELRPFPGTALETLRLRFGASDRPVRADLDREPDPQIPAPAGPGAMGAEPERRDPQAGSAAPEAARAERLREPDPELAPPPAPVLPPPSATP